MNLLQQAKQVWPGLNAKELDLVLWTCTTYPTGDQSEVLADLKNAYEKSGGDLLQALNQADQQKSQAMNALMTGKLGS